MNRPQPSWNIDNLSKEGEYLIANGSTILYLQGMAMLYFNYGLLVAASIAGVLLIAAIILWFRSHKPYDYTQALQPPSWVTLLIPVAPRYAVPQLNTYEIGDIRARHQRLKTRPLPPTGPPVLR